LCRRWHALTNANTQEFIDHTGEAAGVAVDHVGVEG